MTEAGRPVRVGTVGELELRNPTVMLGYWGMPEETASALVDGWLRTGDLVRDNGDGTYTFVGRRKEVIRRRGENLSPAEVEAALQEHPDVVEAAVVTVPSDLGEDDVKAFVVLDAGTPGDPGGCGTGRPPGWRRSSCPATSRSSRSCRIPRPGGWPSICWRTNRAAGTPTLDDDSHDG